ASDDAKAHMASRTPENGGTEHGWQFYASRPFLAGLFYWTGFDYRGEMNPYDWPAVSSQYGILDLCGFPKDIFYYLKSWWGTDPVLHIVPRGNSQGQEGQNARVTVYSNCDQVELLQNARSLGRQNMPHNGHLEWTVSSRAGVLTARGYHGASLVLEQRVEPSGEAAALQMIPDRSVIRADGEDIAVVTVQVADSQGRLVRDDSSTVFFSIDGPGRIIGVGNGDPSSHEADRVFETVMSSNIDSLKELVVSTLNERPEVAAGYDDSAWPPAFQSHRSDDWRVYTDSLIVLRGTFALPLINDATEVNLFTRSVVDGQSVYINGHLIASAITRDAPGQSFRLGHGILLPGRNHYAVTGQRFRKRSRWDEPNTDPGLVQIVSPPPPWKRALFNGLAQAIVQTTTRPGTVTLRASADGLPQAVVTLQSRPAAPRPAVPFEERRASFPRH
ncbi:MAG TPA: DUF4982 domain-containing protein, partial [Bacteroidota bacterium]|nr:DUF4982 domain-containing protein [Bacteroidota bacterium]